MNTFTGIPEFDITKETCFVCGSTADSVEHLFPKWLLRKFNLWDQTVLLPNHTSIPYRLLTVPCCKRCNNEVFSGLESKLSSKTETDKDIWRWANKVHFALTVKDKFLEWDRKNPGNKIGDVISPSDPLEQSRHFLHSVSGDFRTEPDPFGSVFRFDFALSQEFHFIHLISSSSICISLGDRGYVVFIKDGQVLRDGFKTDMAELAKRDFLDLTDMLFLYAKTVEYVERSQISIPLLVTNGLILKTGRAVIKAKPINKELLHALCNHFGFTWLDPEASSKDENQ